MPTLLPPPLALYIHLPWCVRKCPYCDFNSYAVKEALPEAAYVEALERDMESQATEVIGRRIVSIFFGGGTPSLFTPEAINRILEAARRHLTIAPDVEVTLEANPGTIERGRFAGYRAAGVNRVSLGAQTFDANQLKALGRIHSPVETVRAAEELHAADLTNFNLDLMYALPGQDVASAARDVEQALALHPAHLSHYQLTLEPGTQFAANPPTLPPDDLAAEMLTACHEHLGRAGFARYETSAYALPGKQCRHNLNYWTFGDYLGVGAGAHGKLTQIPRVSEREQANAPTGASEARVIYRTTQQREPRRYLAMSPRAISRQPVARADLPFEFMMNALRLTNGFDLDVFTARTGLDWSAVASTFDAFQSRGLVEIAAEACKPTPFGVSFVNEMLLELLPKRAISTGKQAMSMGS
jgi:oxygen-independent coproporphyrinogen-3 oxidase